MDVNLTVGRSLGTRLQLQYGQLAKQFCSRSALLTTLHTQQHVQKVTELKSSTSYVHFTWGSMRLLSVVWVHPGPTCLSLFLLVAELWVLSRSFAQPNSSP